MDVSKTKAQNVHGIYTLLPIPIPPLLVAENNFSIPATFALAPRTTNMTLSIFHLEALGSASPSLHSFMTQVTPGGAWVLTAHKGR